MYDGLLLAAYLFRDVLVDRLRATIDEAASKPMPPVARAQRLAELLARIVANDQAVEHINAHGLPRNHGRLLCAELVARGLDGWVYNSVQTPCITDEAVLPSFQRRQGRGRLSVAALALVRGPARVGLVQRR